MARIFVRIFARSLGGATASLVAALALGACGDVTYDQRPQAPADCAESAGGEAGSPDELSELMAELIAPRICDQVMGSFIGLPGDEGHDGVAGGLDPSVGRWWIRRCEARVTDGRLRVSFGGPGWTWLDRESTGFRVRQYLRFEAEATFAASLHVGYDRRARIASIWLRPAPGVTATVQPTGLVRAEATGVFSSMLGGILDLTGNSASTLAQQQATEEGSERLAQRLQAGFTVTFQLDGEQMDFMLGQLARGETPQRPWNPSRAAWLVNERSAVWPGGMDVLGPIPHEVGPATLEVELEDGDGATVRRVCADVFHQWLEHAWSGQAQGPPPGTQVAELRASHSPQSVPLAQTDCRSVLLVSPGARASVPIMLRYRVTSQEALDAAASPADDSAGVVIVGPSGARVPAMTAATPPATARPAAVRIQLRSVSVSAQTATGANWDVFGGEPDPYVVVTSIPRGRQLDRTTVTDDVREATLDRWLPAAVRIEDFPIRFVVYDEDVSGDEVVGTADLEASAVEGREIDITLDVRSQGATPRQTGVLRLRLAPQP